MSWGYKILIMYGVFVAGITVMVYRSSKEQTDLVTPDYYAQELKYQSQIDEARRADALSSSPEITSKDGQLFIRFPEEFAAQKIKGNALLYCPADAKQDVKKDFTVSDGRLVMSIPADNKKFYQLQLSWEANGEHYYYEKKIQR